ncbi:EF-hand domain-containing family member C2-like [Amphibalanus amphitrite]|uniref:EF-hand domain-containing family member C2-like n=1 Tax=Amphibalanus amphitrite TaxID=1232801 RepID=UPI001C924565|nr:EF-hand domain-containing family member C2-like [Amphibalanus amphitrite]
MSLPFLPGYSEIGKRMHSLKPGYHLPHRFDFKEDQRFYIDQEIGSRDLPRPGWTKRIPRHSFYPRTAGPGLPAWVAFDKQVLRFRGYYTDRVENSQLERGRIRAVKIHFYLEDDTIEVIESKWKNSQLPQGTLLHRHRVPLPEPDDCEFYTIEHLNVSRDLPLYGTIYHITSCDTFTRNFLSKLGVRVNPDSCIPSDPYMEQRNDHERSMRPLKPYKKVDTLGQFLHYDGKVLRFWGYWDDRPVPHGELRDLVLLYYLADDTVELKEIVGHNAGRYKAPSLVRRGKLPKQLKAQPRPGVECPRTVLNTFGDIYGKGMGRHFIFDNLNNNYHPSDFYHDSDLCIGAHVNVWGREVVLTDCDPFTREYYKLKYNKDLDEGRPYRPPKKPDPPRQVPPYLGFGSEEDTLTSVFNLIPQAPKKDFNKFMENDRNGLDGNVLRFSARMVTDSRIDASRQFILSFFLSDDTLSIYEVAIPNSGIAGGRFLERGPVKRDPQSYNDCAILPDCYVSEDLYVGAELVINKHRFRLVAADEYTLRYTDKRPGRYEKANPAQIIQKLRQHISRDGQRQMHKDFNEGYRVREHVCSYSEMVNILRKYAGAVLSEHELITLGRHFCADHNTTEYASQEELVGYLQRVMKEHKLGAECISRIEDGLMHHDPYRTGDVPGYQITNVLRQEQVPLPSDVVHEIIQCLPRTQAGTVNYCEFLKLLDWEKNPVPMPEKKPRLRQPWEKWDFPKPVQTVNYTSLLNEFAPRDSARSGPMPEVSCAPLTGAPVDLSAHPTPDQIQRIPPDPLPMQWCDAAQPPPPAPTEPCPQ